MDDYNCVPFEKVKTIRDDDPQWDGTDAAHPAWGRGQDAAIAVMCRKILAWTRGEEREGCHGSPAIDAARDAVLALVDKLASHYAEITKPEVQ